MPGLRRIPRHYDLSALARSHHSHNWYPEQQRRIQQHQDPQYSSYPSLEIPFPTPRDNQVGPIRARSQPTRGDDKLIIMGNYRYCPEGYVWYKVSGGYRCQVGGHIMDDEQITEWEAGHNKKLNEYMEWMTTEPDHPDQNSGGPWVSDNVGKYDHNPPEARPGYRGSKLPR